MFSSRDLDVIDLNDAGIAESDEEAGLETFATFEENAAAKARYFHALSGRATVADDSGLVVPALGGQPGVLSKRWSGRNDLSGQALDDENNRLLLERIRDAEDRRAFYVCAVAYVDGRRDIVRRGEVHGRIVNDARGGGGFGYDPYFLADELGRTFGEASMAEKARVSHRGRAFAALLEQLENSAGRGEKRSGAG